jgi:flagellar biosynthesis protein FliQ
VTAQDLVGVMERALITTLTVSGPIVIAALAVGLVVSVFQAATQINEATLTFVPKLLVVAVVLVILGPTMIGSLVDLTRFMFGVAATAGPATVR